MNDARLRNIVPAILAAMTMALGVAGGATASDVRFDGQFFRGEGEAEYLQLLDISRRMFAADAELQSFGMLYAPAWNGFCEGPTWGAWWIQNSYGPTWCGLPVFEEPLVSFLQNAQDLWFDQMGDGKRASFHGWIGPDGCLCDCASPGQIIYKQGDGRVEIHDWGVEFTAAGIVMQAELLLVGRDLPAIRRYLPKLEHAANFLETRRDPKNNLFLAGPAGNLLAPSYAGWKRPDGSYGQAYLAGLSITCIAALDRLVELEKLAGEGAKARLYAQRHDLARKGLPLLTTDEGYLIKSLDPDGTRHGVYGAAKHGYFEAVANHDAICFRVVDDAQAARIYAKIASIAGLRPHHVILTNYPSLDDMYAGAQGGIWDFGTWVNGGHWSTCEARMVMAYCQLGKYDDVRRSMGQLMKFARSFRMDNPLVDRGNAVYQPGENINLCYDSFGAPAAMIRGLFEYQYRAEGLTLVPHIPPAITRLEQHFPIRFGAKRLYLATSGAGPVTGVWINGRPWAAFDVRSIRLPYDQTPAEAVIQVALGEAKPAPFAPRPAPRTPPPIETLDRLAPIFPTIAVSGRPLRIGADSRGESRFRGEIGRAWLFRRALGSREIETIAAARGKSSPLDKDPDLVGRWTFDARKGDCFPDAAGEHLPARVVGEAAVVDGPMGKAVRLAGSGYLEVAAEPRLELNRACTMAAWIRPETQPPAGARILDKTTVGGSDGYLLDTCPGNSLRLIVERGSLGYDARLAPGRWTHVAATIGADGSEALYIDGKQVAAQKLSFSAEMAAFHQRIARMEKLNQRLTAAGLASACQAAHARLAGDYVTALLTRLRLEADGRLPPLPGASRAAADKSYFLTAARLCEGLERVLDSYKSSGDSRRKQVYEIWRDLAR